MDDGELSFFLPAITKSFHIFLAECVEFWTIYCDKKA